MAIGTKWLELLKEVAPGVTRAAVVFNPQTGIGQLFWPPIESVAPSLGVEVTPVVVLSAASLNVH